VLTSVSDGEQGRAVRVGVPVHRHGQPFHGPLLAVPVVNPSTVAVTETYRRECHLAIRLVRSGWAWQQD
jgi:hypothetical protein